jgi:hypothetical protein
MNRQVSTAVRRAGNLLCLLAAGLLASPSFGARVPADGRVTARVKYAVTTDLFIGHGPPYYYTFSLVPGSGGREFLLEIGPATGCVGEEPSFWRTYNRLAATIPPLRVRYDPAHRRITTSNRETVIQARARTDKEAASLLSLCDLDGEREREEARGLFEKSRREPFRLNEDEWFKRLGVVFLGLRATKGLTDLRPRRVAGACPKLVGARLAGLRLKGLADCTTSVDLPHADSDREDIAAFHISARERFPSGGSAELSVVFTVPRICEGEDPCADDDPKTER